ncbi:DUF2474 domain-containing protein [Rhizobium binxianense]|jgi:hypothetical protein
MPDVITPKHWLRRLGWLALIWTVSVIVLGVVAMFLRLLLSMAGMTV